MLTLIPPLLSFANGHIFAMETPVHERFIALSTMDVIWPSLAVASVRKSSTFMGIFRKHSRSGSCQQPHRKSESEARRLCHASEGLVDHHRRHCFSDCLRGLSTREVPRSAVLLACSPPVGVVYRQSLALHRATVYAQVGPVICLWASEEGRDGEMAAQVALGRFLFGNDQARSLHLALLVDLPCLSQVGYCLARCHMVEVVPDYPSLVRDPTS
jgi:hypothetical protein